MKLRNFIAIILVGLAAFISCDEQNTQLGAPSLVLDSTEIVFDQAGGEQTVSFTSTRTWMATADAEWLVVSPEAGEASSEKQSVVITALENTGMDREATVTVTIGMISRYITVTQAGPEGSAEQLVIYFNNFDQEEATKTYGSGSSWPFLDQFDGWKNQTGTGIANIEYAFKGMSARANSTSNSNYSDYEGSGSNNMFFGSNAYFAVKNLALNGATDILLTFGTEKYSQDNGSIFTPSEYHIYLSEDGVKWVELTDYTFAGGTTEGRWNVASAAFILPEGTESLSICMATDVASSYRMDDLSIVISPQTGTVIDFSEAVEMDFSEGGSGNNSEGRPSPDQIIDVTVAEFLAAEPDENTWYRLTGTVVGPINGTYGNFDLKDETGQVYVYGIDNWSEYSSKVDEGGTIVVVGNRFVYNNTKDEVKNGYIESYDESTENGGGGDEKPDQIIDVTVAEFLAAEPDENTWYRLSGTVQGSINTTYGNFDIQDETGSVYVYGISNWSDYKDKVAVGGQIVIVGNRFIYTPSSGDPKDEVMNAYIESYEGSTSGGDDNSGDDDNFTDTGDYDPKGLTWTLGKNAYDKTSSTAQTAIVNNVKVNNLLKLGKSSEHGDATIHVPAGTKKVGGYFVSWKNKPADVVFSVGGTEIYSVTPAANDGASNNPEYTITVTESDYYEFEVNATEATDIEVKTTGENCRAMFIALTAITE